MNYEATLFVAILIGVWFFLLRTRATRLEGKDQFTTLLGGGQPVVVDFFSNT